MEATQVQQAGTSVEAGATLETKAIPQAEVVAQAGKATSSEDLITRASKVKLESKPTDLNIEEPKFDVNDIEKIADPQAKEQALRAYKSFQRGFNQKFQELAELRKQVEAKNQPTQWTPERIRTELNKPDFIQASQAVLQEQNPPNSGMNETEWSSLTVAEKKQWQAMQSELTSLKQQQANQQIMQNFKLQDETAKTKYANYDSQAVDIITDELLQGKRQATREDIFKSFDYENAVKRAYELGKQDGQVDKTEKTNASTFDGVTNTQPAKDIPQPEKNEGVTSYFGRLVQRNIEKMKAQR
jgi:hypothetical protein